MKLTLFIKAGEKTVYFDQPIVVGGPGGPRGSGGHIMLKKATVFWNYNNVMKKFENNLVSFDGKEAYIPEGYLDFDAIETSVKSLAERSGKTVDFGKNIYDGTSRIKTTGKLEFGKMGLLLGFKQDDIITGVEWTNSPNQVDINKGLRYVEILCDAVESEKSLHNGKRSDIISTLPITSEQRLKGSVQHYTDIESKVEIRKGIYNNMTFRVRWNNGSENIGVVLLELYIG